MGYKNDDRCLQKVDDDEPIFVLRAQDATMVPTISDWLQRNPQLPPERIAEVADHIGAVENWQRAHAGRVKMPD